MTTLTIVLPEGEAYSPTTGGAIATVAHDLTRALTTDGVTVRVVAPTTSAARYPGELHPIRSVRSLPAKVLARAARTIGHPLADETARYHAAVREAVDGHRTVLVHNDAALAAQLAAAGHQVLLWLHNLLADGDSLRAAASAGTRMIAVSAYVRAWTATTYDIDDEIIDVAYNTVDLTEFRPPDTWTPTGRVRAVIHGRIDPGKGQVLAAKAVARARAYGAPVDLTVVGSVRTFGMTREQVDAYVDELRTAIDDAQASWIDAVPRNEIPELLRTFDASLALPTVPEPFSLAALEGMASGCATIAVPVGGLTEVVGDAALTCDAEVEDIAEALCALTTGDALPIWRNRARDRAATFAWPGSITAVVLAAMG